MCIILCFISYAWMFHMFQLLYELGVHALHTNECGDSLKHFNYV
jgi:hypothetical protein